MAWFTTVLKKLGAPQTSTNRRVLSLWAQSEGTPDSINNWLACGTPWPGSHAYNSSGVQVYPTFDAGTSAIAFSLAHSPYAAIGAAFRAAAAPLALYRLINASPWCGGCQSGHYPVALWEGVGSPTSATPTPPSTVAPPTGAGSGAPTPHQATVASAWANLQFSVGPRAATVNRRMIGLAEAIRKA